MSGKALIQTMRRDLLQGTAALLGAFLAPTPADVANATSESTMRMMMRLTIPVEKGNEAIASGAWDQTLNHIIETLKPEAAHFHLDSGRRAATFIYEADKAEEMAVIKEPVFRALDASIDQQPVLTAADLGKALHPK